ncbi:hypothetical protein YpE1979001_2510 [Yersinia pestis biovar Antiqua str. E1979001]|nr:hypothetical protein YpE1979001_2510 [Yersinia pestis biovar Antiqua str. E1979001]
MFAFVPIPGQITNREALRVIRQGREPTQAVSVQKPLCQLNNLLVLFVAGAEFFYPGIEIMLCRIPALLLIPTSFTPQPHSTNDKTNPNGLVLLRYLVGMKGFEPSTPDTP